jgi:phosphoribosyl-AMP cyclohydrolase
MNSDQTSGFELNPKYNADGLLTAVISDSADKTILMVGHMNAEALKQTLETGIVHFYSRSRKQLWKKGETSGHFLTVVDILIDCDQDALLIQATPAGPTCHTGVRSCFYRRVTKDGLSAA